MARVDFEGDKIILNVSPEERLDLRKHALYCAVRMYVGQEIKSPIVQQDLLALADRFNLHLLRNPSENG